MTPEIKTYRIDVESWHFDMKGGEVRLKAAQTLHFDHPHIARLEFMDGETLIYWMDLTVGTGQCYDIPLVNSFFMSAN